MNVIYSTDIKNFWTKSSNDFCKQVMTSCLSNRYFSYIFNLETLKYEWMSEGVTNVLGYDKSNLDVLLAIDNIHPDDQGWHTIIENKLQELSEEFGKEWLANYKIVCDFRFKTSSGLYIRLLKQMIQVCESDVRKRYCLISDISFIKKNGEPRLSLIGLGDNDSIEDIPLQINNIPACPFSPREKEIISFIFYGLTSKEIAGRLSISPDTVKNHKKNIFTKASCNSSLQLLNKCIAYNWIERSDIILKSAK